jgi:hypothetical protein
MNNEHDTERLFVGRCALMLFIGGLLIPLILAILVFALAGANVPSGAKDFAYGLCFGFGLVAEVLALILGTIGRRHLSGKTAQVGVIVLLVAWVVLGVLGSAVWFVRTHPDWFTRPEPPKKEYKGIPGGTPAKTPTLPTEKPEGAPGTKPKESDR